MAVDVSAALGRCRCRCCSEITALGALDAALKWLPPAASIFGAPLPDSAPQEQQQQMAAQQEHDTHARPSSMGDSQMSAQSGHPQLPPRGPALAPLAPPTTTATAASTAALSSALQSMRFGHGRPISPIRFRRPAEAGGAHSAAPAGVVDDVLAAHGSGSGGSSAGNALLRMLLPRTGDLRGSKHQERRRQLQRTPPALYTLLAALARAPPLRTALCRRGVMDLAVEAFVTGVATLQRAEVQRQRREMQRAVREAERGGRHSGMHSSDSNGDNDSDSSDGSSGADGSSDEGSGGGARSPLQLPASDEEAAAGTEGEEDAAPAASAAVAAGAWVVPLLAALH